MSDISQESVLGPVLFKVLVNNMGSGIKQALNKFANDVELCGTANTVKMTSRGP